LSRERGLSGVRPSVCRGRLGQVGAPYHGEVTSSATSETPGAAIAVVRLAVEGMHCGSCVALIEETLNEREGVTAALVDLDSARAVIEYDPSMLDVAQIRGAIADAGYSATPVS
jgi:copper chaperone